ncbi:hypothetical protein WKK05_00245 [Nostoc sp. UHCC 0302]|uniref:hypothetical protein n=1 Tax=Nostoc sp. UHCC 0302 TaxID=3134896 RepID=UPI00311CE0A4
MKFATLIDSTVIVAVIAFTSGIASAQPLPTNNDFNAGATTTVSSKTLPTNSSNDSYLKPFNLVSLAYQGGLKQQGIPSGGTLIFERQNKNITAEDLVKAAVKANKLPTGILDDQSYISSVKSELTSLSRNFTY